METFQRTPCTIEPASLQDLRAVADMQRDLWRREGRRRAASEALELLIERHVHGTGRVIIARQGGSVQGCVVLEYGNTGLRGRCAVAGGLLCYEGVPPKTALRLMQAAATQLEKDGFTEVYAMLNTPKNRHRRTYPAMGFRPLPGQDECHRADLGLLRRALAERLN